MTSARIVLADDHPILLAGIRMLIASAGDMEVVGESHSGPSALEMVRSSDPSVAILDISLPEINGILLTRRLIAEKPSLAVIILTLHEDRSYIDQALEAGARGYVLKRSASECLLHGIATFWLAGSTSIPASRGGCSLSHSANGRRCG
jgi:DNA-binding NarL/FixJ family response regulator